MYNMDLGLGSMSELRRPSIEINGVVVEDEIDLDNNDHYSNEMASFQKKKMRLSAHRKSSSFGSDFLPIDFVSRNNSSTSLSPVRVFQENNLFTSANEPSTWQTFCKIINSVFSECCSKFYYCMAVKKSDSMQNGSEEDSLLQMVEAEAISCAQKDGFCVLSNRDFGGFPNFGKAPIDRLILLDLSANGIITLPNSIENFVHLKSLFLNQNRLRCLPEAIGDLACLEILGVGYNFLLSLPSNVAKLQNLRQLKLCSNYLSEFPNQIFHLPKLEILDMSKNRLQEIPNGIGHMKIVDLNLNENYISYLSDDLGRLNNLKILRIQNNKLKLNSIPESLFAATEISQFHAEGNLFEVENLAHIEGYEDYLLRNNY